MIENQTPPQVSDKTSRRTLTVVILLSLTLASAFVGRSTFVSRRGLDRIPPTDIEKPSPSTPSISWRPLHCFPESVVRNWRATQVCAVGDCFNATVANEFRQQILRREAHLRSRPGSSNASLDSEACVFHRSGLWIDAQTGAPAALSAEHLRARGEVLVAMIRTSRCSLGEWLSMRSCDDASFPHLTSYDFISLLHVLTNPSTKGNVRPPAPYILFTGDSITRQLHARLVHLMRDVTPPVMEHTSLGEVTYLVRADGDELIVRSRFPKGPSRSGKHHKVKVPMPPAKPYALDGSHNGTWLVRLDFVWQATVDEYDVSTLVGVDRDAFFYPPPVAHVHSVMYWQVSSGPDAGLIAAFMNKTRAIAMARPSSTALLFATTPMVEVGRPHSLSNKAANEFYSARNEAMRRWVNQSASGSGRLYVFDMAAMLHEDGKAELSYANRRAMQRKDDKHFMCTADPKQPQAVTLIRLDRAGCQDLMNARLSRHLLSALCLIHG